MIDEAKFELDLNRLEIGDLEYLEDIFGEDVLEQLQANKEDGNKKSLPTKLLIHLVYVFLRHDNPDATLDDARRIKITDIVSGEDEDPE